MASVCSPLLSETFDPLDKRTRGKPGRRWFYCDAAAPSSRRKRTANLLVTLSQLELDSSLLRIKHKPKATPGRQRLRFNPRFDRTLGSRRARPTSSTKRHSCGCSVEFYLRRDGGEVCRSEAAGVWFTRSFERFDLE